MSPKLAEAPPQVTPAEAQLAKQLVRISRRDISDEAKMQLTLNAVKGFVTQNPMQFDRKAADGLARNLTTMISVLEQNRPQYTGDYLMGRMFTLVKGSTQRQMGFDDSRSASESAMAIQRSYEGMIALLKDARGYAESLRDREHPPEDRARYIATTFTKLNDAMKLADGMGTNFMNLSQVFERSAQRTDAEFKTSAAVSAAVGIAVGGWAIGAALGVGIAGGMAIGAATGVASEAAVVGITQKRLVTPKEAAQAALLGAVFSGAFKAAGVAKAAKAAKAAAPLAEAEGLHVAHTAAGVGVPGFGAAVGKSTAVGGYKAGTRMQEQEERQKAQDLAAAKARKRKKS